MNTRAFLTVASLALGVVVAAAPSGRVSAAGAAPVRIGTFDSRAVALAYYRSPDRKADIGAMRAELEKAKASGDQQKVADLEARGPAMQMLMHQQVFSNGSIGNIMPAVAPKLAEIAKAAGVVAIVSQWELPHAAPNVELVDVTPQILALFTPDVPTSKILESMKGQKPIALIDALMIKD